MRTRINFLGFIIGLVGPRLKLSMIPNKFIQWLTSLRGEKLKEEKKIRCPANPDVTDTLVRNWEDDGEFYSLKECGNVEANRPKEEKRY